MSKDHVRTMTALTPIERLRQLPDIAGHALPRVDELLDVYRSYLERTDRDKEEILSELQHDEQVRVEVPREGSKFTKLMFELIQELGEGRPLHRHMLV